jgi:hypothetical protein
MLSSKHRHLRRLIGRILVVILPVYSLWWLYIEYFPLYYSSPTATRWYFFGETLENPDELPAAQYLFLGESRLNAALDFNEIPDAYSFAAGGATPVEMYYLLEKYCEVNAKPDTLFFSVSPRFLIEKFVFWHYAVRTNFFDSNEMSEIFHNADQFSNDTLLGTLPKAHYFLYCLNYPGYYQQDVRKNYGFRAYERNLNMIEDMRKRKGGRAHRGLKSACSALNHETRYQAFQPSPLLDFYLSEILHFCKMKDIPLIFLFMPMNESSVQALKPEFISDYENYFKELQREFPNFELQHKIYAWPDSLFGDPSHLNQNGKERYTKKFLEKYCPQ